MEFITEHLLTLLNGGLVIIIPPIVDQLVKLLKRLPKWTIPLLIVPSLTAVGEWLATVIASGEFSPLVAGLLALAAIGWREIVDQVGKALKKGEPVPRMGDDPMVVRR